MKTKYTIDAKDRKLGRVASEAAHILQGKNTPDFTRNNVADVEVVITNTSQISITEKKKEEKKYAWFSGYPGGLRFEKLRDALDKKGIKEVLRRTISGMLPKNKLRAKMIKNITMEG